MIYTLTTNPAIDMNVTAERLVPNVVSRTANPVYTPNGKGLNVSFTLHHFGVDSTILGFFGGFSGRYIVDGAREKGCEVKPVWVDGITRINTFISLMDGSGDEYKLPNAGCPVPRAQQLEMLELLRTLPDLDVLVISGSLSPQIDPSFYDEIIDVLEGRGAEFVLDISHPCLAHLIERGPLLIKPNDEELGQIFGIGVADESEIPDALREICSRGAKNVLLTMGGNGAFFTVGEKVWRARSTCFPTHARAMPRLQRSSRGGSLVVRPWRRRFAVPWPPGRTSPCVLVWAISPWSMSLKEGLLSSG